MSDLVTVLLSAAVALVVALLVAVAAGKLARLDGASYPAAVLRAATAFASVVTLTAAVTAALASLPR
ncbi:hypothetical protein ACF065_25225 [Streptomyces sp. NPDC015232]|uniref:hypothetical protein n=1 Tax=unclassified Streptomyces TaxID=2593676 RepID=UPI003701A0F8